MSATAERWVVRCDDYTKSGYQSEADAKRAIASIEEFGQCPLPHEAVRQ